MEKFILLGASRGLGWETYLQLKQKSDRKFFLSSRRMSDKKNEITEDAIIVEQDFSKVPVNENFVKSMQDFLPTHLIYFAGGGPYGLFQNKKWFDHLWALQTSFLYPAELVHLVLTQSLQWPELKQIILIGSAIAEDKPDALASSYAAAKHALKGLVGSINAEQNPTPKLLLFSPAYMQTDLLPRNSQPRLSDKAENPVVVAERLIEYIENN